MDEIKQGREKTNREREEEMIILILTGMVAIILLLAFIALMVYAIGEKVSKK
jgi:Na+-transporting methylmalonyl-CoA/oxaloacetate decarboxylase gamma subunit|tara:strand:- start:305 stop:460 length:156 start_codon:yes stop_codon:yes gene_type:complete